MASVSLTLPNSIFVYDTRGGFSRWMAPTGSRPSLGTALSADGEEQFLADLIVSITGRNRFVVRLSNDQTADFNVGGDDFTVAFETGGTQEMTDSAGNSVTIAWSEVSDTSDPYDFNVNDLSNTDDVLAWSRNIYEDLTDRSITVVFDDNAATAPVTAPTNLILQSNTNGSLTFAAWTPPTDNGGSPILHYDIEYREVGTTDWTHLDNVEEGHTVTGLTPHDTYEGRVRGVNAEGDGPWSGTPYPNTNIRGQIMVPGTELDLRFSFAVPDLPGDLIISRTYLNDVWINNDKYLADAFSAMPTNGVAITDEHGRPVPEIVRPGYIIVGTSDGPRALPVPQFGVWRLEMVSGVPAWVEQ